MSCALVFRIVNSLDLFNISEGYLQIMLSDLVENCAVALFRPSIMMAVLGIIMENVPELMALDLSDNNLCALTV
jgi:hypothetical protein